MNRKFLINSFITLSVERSFSLKAVRYSSILDSLPVVFSMMFELSSFFSLLQEIAIIPMLVTINIMANNNLLFFMM